MNRISIITAVFNSASTIKDCLESVICQDYPEIEYIIIDGGSSDSTIDIVESYRSHISVIISEKDQGVYDAINKGLQQATGDIIGILNSDDMYPTRDVISSVVKVFKDQAVDACYGDLVYVDSQDTNKVVRYWRSDTFNYKKFYWGWMPPHPTFFVKKKIYDQYGGFRLDKGTAADYELMLRFLVKNKIAARNISKILVKMRVGGLSNKSIQNRLRANHNDRMAWKVNGLRAYPFTIILKPLRKVGQFVTSYSQKRIEQ